MRINSQLPAVPTRQKSSSTNSPLIKQGQSREFSSTLPVSSEQHFEKTMGADRLARFHRVDDMSAKAQLALQAYHDTEVMSSDHPRNQLIGVDVFA